LPPVLRKPKESLALKPHKHLLNAAQLFIPVHGAAENGLLFQAGVRPERINTVPQAQRGLRAVAESSADAFAISAVTAWQLVSRHPQSALEVRTLSDGPVGLPAFAFRIDEEPLGDAMNQALHTYLGSDNHKTLVQRVGFTSDELPLDTL